MRENIGLYRGITMDTKELVYGRLFADDVIIPYNQPFEIEANYIYADDFKGYIIDPNTLGEYSGVDDKNGINLYEGDLVEARLCEGNWQGFSWGVQKVVFKNGAFGLLNSKEDFTPFANFADRVEFIKKGTVFD